MLVDRGSRYLIAFGALISADRDDEDDLAILAKGESRRDGEIDVSRGENLFFPFSNIHEFTLEEDFFFF